MTAETLQLAAHPDSLAQINQFVADFCESHHIGPEIMFELQLVLEELIVNVYMHGGAGVEGELTVAVSLACADSRLQMTVTDNGRQFDPLAQCAPATDLALEERPVGGLGIMLVREMMDDMHYQYADGTNQLSMSKSLER
ncbi:MAG: ATP-binding protein [Haliea sp.]